MMHHAIDQTDLILTSLIYRSDFKITSPIINDENYEAAYAEHGEDVPLDYVAEGYNWYPVMQLDGTEEHVAHCLGSTWVGVRKH